MAHINTIGASMFSDLAVSKDTTQIGVITPKIAAGTVAQTDFESAFQAADFTANTAIRIRNVREFPSMGTPPNVVNVPVYGSKTSQQIQGQADANSMEITMNYVPADWASNSTLGALVGDGKLYCFRFTLMNADPTTQAGNTEGYASSAAGLGTTQNSEYYFMGKIEALLVNPQLTDATTATLTITLQSALYGAYTLGT